MSTNHTRATILKCRCNLTSKSQNLFIAAVVLSGFCLSQRVQASESSFMLPTAKIPLTVPTAKGKVSVVSHGSDLQSAIDMARPGDQILLAAGATFTGSYTLPYKSGDSWVTIRSAGILVGEGARATEGDTASMATLMAPGGNAPALQTAPGARNYHIIGLNITAAPGVKKMTSLVNLGDGGPAQNTISSQPQNIIIDRSYIHGSDLLDLRRGVTLNAANSAIVNSTIGRIHSADSDSQAIAGWNGAGPYLIQNNFLEAAGENVMFGGADPSIPNLIPSDITIRGNTFYKPPSWRGTWLVKNLLEFKLGQRVLVEDNTFSNNWADGQSGFAINVKSTNQTGSAPWSNTSNVTIRNNLIENSPSGISIAANPESGTAVPTSNVAISGNVFKNIGGTASSPAGTLFQLIGSSSALSNIAITGNRAVEGNSHLNNTMVFDGQPTQGLTFTGNVLTQGLYGIKGSGTAEGSATLLVYAPGAIFSGNTIIGGTAANYGRYSRINDF